MQLKNNATDRIGSERIGKLLWDFSVPAIIGMLVNAIYNIVDRIYVGQGVDPLGIAGITLVMPVMLVIQAASMLVGIGANSLFSIRLGQGRSDEVEHIMGQAFVLLFAIPLVIIIFCLVFSDWILVTVLGASESVLPYARTYYNIILYGSIFAAMSPGLNHFIRSDGHPRTSMTTQIIGAGINIVLDPIFIFGFGWGIAGAAWATIISQFISFVWVLWYWNSPLTTLRIRLRNMRLEMPLVLKICAIGFAPCVMQLAVSLIQVLMNKSLGRYGGDIAITAGGIMLSVVMVCIMTLQGLSAGAQPIIGYNYGAGQFGRVRQTLKWALISGTIILVVIWGLIQLFPSAIISLFTKDQGELREVAAKCLRVVTLTFPIIGIHIIGSSYFQAVGKPIQSTILSMTRQVLFYIPALFILPRFLGLTGVYAAMPVSDVFAVAVTGLFLLREWKKLKVYYLGND
jgi:putative MATE family efflux protein